MSLASSIRLIGKSGTALRCTMKAKLSNIRSTIAAGIRLTLLNMAKCTALTCIIIDLAPAKSSSVSMAMNLMNGWQIVVQIA